MTLEECYTSCGGDYQDVLRRLQSENLIRRFLGKFLDDKSYEQLHENLNNQHYSEAFRAAHTLKGVCQNLGLGYLSESSIAVTEALRDGKQDVTAEMLKKLDEDYRVTVLAIQSL